MQYLHRLVPEKTIYRILLVCISILIIYYPAISAEISLIDDLDMVNALLNTETIYFLDILFPRSTGGGYYRPLLGLSQYVDRKFWMMDSTFMHLENILIHLVNAILVYLLALKLSVRLSLKTNSLAPLAASLIFALHPIVTESVNWISGRTDSMACNFILISAIFLFRYHDDGKKLNLVFSGAALLLSLFAKEVAFGYILALPFLFSMPRYDTAQIVDPVVLTNKKELHPFIIFLLFFSASVVVAMYVAAYWSVIFIGCCYMLYSLWLKSGKKPLYVTIKEHVAATILLVCVVLATFALFFVFRKIAFSSNIDRISNTFKLIFQDTSYAISVFLGSAGFYVKKFFLPLPLNFFILEINPLYDLIGIAVFLVALWLILRCNTLSALAITGMCCVLPAFPFAFGTIAWTGYAERYIYVASAFWSIAVTLFVARLCAERKINSIVKISINAGVIVVLIFMAVITFQRNITWQTNKALIADTVDQNPNQKDLRGLYMLAFMRSGDLKSAREQYRIASSLKSNKYLENYDLNMAAIEVSEGDKAAAEVLFKKVLNDTHGKSVSAIKSYTKFLESEFKRTKDALLQDEIISLYNQLYMLNKDPFYLYRLGQIYIARKDDQAAITMFEQAAHAYPPGSIYGENSSKIAQKLKKKMQL